MSAGTFAHWSPLQTLLVWILGTCVVAVVWYAVFYRAAHDEWVAAGNELSAARSDLAAAQAERRLAEGRASELDGDAEALARARAQVAGGAGPVQDLLFTIPALANEVGLRVDRWHPLPDEAAGALRRAPVEVEARGSWTALAELLRRVSALPQVIAVDRLELRAGVDGELELRLVIGALRLGGAP